MTFDYDGFGRLSVAETEDGPVSYGYGPLGNRAWRLDVGDGHSGQPLLAPALPPASMPLIVEHHDRPEPMANPDPFLGAPHVTALEDIVAVYTETGEALHSLVHGPGIDEPLLLLQDDRQFMMLGDGLGSVRRLLGDEGDTVASYEYDAFGNTISAVDPLMNPYRFAGRALDPVTDLYDFRARTYDPFLGRFLSSDRIVTDRPENLYTFARNNPLVYTDPTGLEFEAKAPFADRLRHYSPTRRGGYTWPKIEVNIPPRYAGVQIEDEACCWIIPGTGKFKFSAQAGHVRPGDQGTLPQGGNGAGSTVTIPPAAGADNPAGRINAHEDEHVALWRKAHDTFIGPLEQRVASVTWPKWHKHGKTVKECIEHLKKCIRWKETIALFIAAGNAANEALDKRDANYMRGQWVNRNGQWVWELHNSNPAGYSQNYPSFDNQQQFAMQLLASLFSFGARDCPPHDPCLPRWFPPWWFGWGCPPGAFPSPTPSPLPRPTPPAPTGQPSPQTPTPGARTPITPTPVEALPVPQPSRRLPGASGGTYAHGTPDPRVPWLGDSSFHVDRDAATPGTALSYTLHVRETGGASTSATVEIAFPSALRYVLDSVETTTGTPTFDADAQRLDWSATIEANATASLTLAAEIDLFLEAGTVVPLAATLVGEGTADRFEFESSVTVVEDPVLECVKRLASDSRDEYGSGSAYRQILRTYSDDPEEFLWDEVEIYRSSSLCTSQQRACGRSIYNHLRSSDAARVAQLANVFWLVFTGEAPE